MLARSRLCNWLADKGVRVKSEWIDFLFSNILQNFATEPLYLQNSVTDSLQVQNSVTDSVQSQNLESINPLQLQNWIWTQFQLADLSIFGVPSLEMLKNPNTVLILQVEETINISESFYSQVNRLEDKLNGTTNRLISNEDEVESAHSSKILVKYILSDGYSCIHCLFLDSLKDGLNLNLEIGHKISVNSADVAYFESENIYFVKNVQIISTASKRGSLSEAEKRNNLKELLAEGGSQIST